MKKNQIREEIFLAGGCLWGVQEFVRYLPGVVFTEAGRANGKIHNMVGDYDGYAECVRVVFDPIKVTVSQLMDYFFEIIDPYSVNQQGDDMGKKYRTGVYSCCHSHLTHAREHIDSRNDSGRVVVEVLPLTNYVKSDEEHQDRLQLHPSEECHIPKVLLHKYRR